MKRYPTVVLGAGGVGKSALTVRFMKNKFADSYDPTIEETYRKPMKVDGELLMLEVWDTAGAEQFNGMSEHYIHLTQESSIREIEALRWQIHRIKGLSPPPGQPTANSPDLPIVVVGTKSDLIGEREVGRDVLHQITQMWGCPIFETSAKNNWNVDEVFEDIVKQMRMKLPEEATKPRDKKKKDPKCIII